MLEAVGAEYFATFFEACDRALVPGGRLSLQIDHLPGRRLRAPAPRRELDPDLHLPGRPAARRSRSSSGRTATRSLLIERVDDIAADYVLTLRAWRTRFMAQPRRRSARMGFDDRFVRMWEYYLATQRGRLRDGHQPGPADRLRERSRIAAGRRRPDRSWVRAATIGAMDRLRDRVCLITGSTGIAAAAAVRSAAEGASRLRHLADGRPLRGTSTDRLVAGGARAGWAAADLADEAATDAAVAAAVERFGRIDGCFSVAGGSGRRFGDGPIHELTLDGWDRTISLNLRSQAVVAGRSIRQMLAPGADGDRGRAARSC